jgi:DNA-binding transcriptional LysR family regulator
VTELILKEAAEAVHLERVYETDMAEGLKAMALEGHGVAFCPIARCAASWSPVDWCVQCRKV